MEENKQIIGNIESTEKFNNLSVKSKNSPFFENFYFAEMYEEAALKRFIKSTERLIRSSREYNSYLGMLKGSCAVLNKDNILSNITAADAELELHHYPFSLYDIVETVVWDHFIKKEKFNSFSLAKEIMEEHFKNNIGLVPLSKTMHELAHGGNIFISSKQVFGDYHRFMKKYEKGIRAELKKKIEEMEKKSQEPGVVSDFNGYF